MQKSEPLELTVIEHFTDMDVVHVHCKRKVLTENLIHPRRLAELLVDSSEVLKNREYRLYYVVPAPLGTVFPLSDAISFDVFFEWHRRSNVNDVYAVVVNRTTPDCKTVMNLYLNQIPTVHYNKKQAEHFKRTVAKPFSHRPMEPEVDSTSDGRFKNQQCNNNLVELLPEITIHFALIERQSKVNNKNHYNSPAHFTVVKLLTDTVDNGIGVIELRIMKDEVNFSTFYYILKVFGVYNLKSTTSRK